jgi:hypothetical protein
VQAHANDGHIVSHLGLLLGRWWRPASPGFAALAIATAALAIATRPAGTRT